MAPAEDHYEVLGIGSGADPAEIRRAYVKQARRFHPDAHAGRTAAERAHAERRMRDVNEAWRVLSDPGRRRAYDERRTLADPPRASRARPAGPGWRPRVDDDGWMHDYAAWRDETDVLPPDPPGERRPVRILPAAILALGAAVALLGTILTSRPMLAVAFMLAGISLALWVWLPMAELARGRASDAAADRRARPGNR
ncbi:MAG: J domain-containing protein [Acidimicrobiales bacterium]|nr:J domain-containing protein [Acidimicrobiales bacterium]